MSKFYLQLKQKSHLGKPIHLTFPKGIDGKKGENKFGGVEIVLDAIMVSPAVYKTTPKQDGTSFEIKENQEFYFTVSETLHRHLKSAYVDESTALSVELYLNETGNARWLVNVAEGDINYSYTDKDDIPFNPNGAKEMNDKTYESEDAKWDAINRKKRLEIAHGQAYNIATMTVNGGNPKSFWVDSSEWRNQVHKVAMTIYPLLVEEPSEPDGTVPNTKKEEEVVIKSEKVTADEPKPFADDELPF